MSPPDVSQATPPACQSGRPSSHSVRAASIRTARTDRRDPTPFPARIVELLNTPPLSPERPRTLKKWWDRESTVWDAPGRCSPGGSRNRGGMVFLLLRILFTVAFSHLLRLSQARTRWPMGAAAVNYLVAAVACAGWAAQAGGGWHGRTALLGGLAGFTYVTSLLFILPSMRRSGVSLTGAVVQLALMLPVGVS